MQTKLKPKKSAVKRFKVTATGKLLRSHSGKQHLAVKKSGACVIASHVSIMLLPPTNAPLTLLPSSLSLVQATTSHPCHVKRLSGDDEDDNDADAPCDCAASALAAPARCLRPCSPFASFAVRHQSTHFLASDADSTNIKRLLALR